MGLHNQPRGEEEVIYPQDEQVGQLTEAEPGDYEPPIRFVEARLRNPYRLLIDLHDQAFGINASHENLPQQHLAELALSAAVVDWWSRWQPISMHRALEAGAHVAEVAAAAGLTARETYERWSAWATVQSRLLIGGRPCVDPDVVARIQAQVREQMPPGE